MLDGQYLTVAEASERLGITKQGIRARIRRGKLCASKRSRAWFIIYPIQDNWWNIETPASTNEWRV